MIALKHILVPHDFSETSDAAVKYAIALARTFGAQLHMLHVGEKVKAEIETEFPLGLDSSLEVAVRERLLKMVTPRDQQELKPEFDVRVGTPYVEIVAYAKEHGMDLIVMGTHGRGLVAHSVMGSVAEKVVRYAPCPVLTVHNSARDFVVPEEVAMVAPRVSA
jgi:nucleotide-binding universal stress UspA family protein